jgi:hypothetical protein
VEEYGSILHVEYMKDEKIESSRSKELFLVADVKS